MLSKLSARSPDVTQAEAFLLTIGLEAPVAAGLALLLRGRAALWPGLFGAVLGSGLTHPVVWALALSLYPVAGFVASFLLVEALAIAGETLIYRLLLGGGWGLALLLSVAANAVSAGVGLVLTGVI